MKTLRKLLAIPLICLSLAGCAKKYNFDDETIFYTRNNVGAYQVVKVENAEGKTITYNSGMNDELYKLIIELNGEKIKFSREEIPDLAQRQFREYIRKIKDYNQMKIKNRLDKKRAEAVRYLQ